MATPRGTRMRIAAVAGAIALLAGCSGGSAHSSGPAPRSAGHASPTTTGQSNEAGSTVPSTTAAQPSRGTGSTVSPTRTAATASCTLPLTHPADVGFHIAVPSSWDLSTLNGEAVVSTTPAQTEAVLVYPALLTNGLTAASFFTSYLSKLNQENAAAGAPVSTTPASGANGMPAVGFTQTVNGTTIQGYATVKVLPLAAPGATQEAAYIAYWAPSAAFASARAELSAISACYGPEPGSPFRVFQNQVFTYAVPPGWTPFDENSNGIDLHGPDSSDVSYILDGPVETSQFDSPQTMVAWFTHGVGISGVTSLSSVASPQSQASNGGTQSDLYEEFTGQTGGQAVRGLVYSYVVLDGSVATGFIRMLESPTSDWNSLNPSMLQIAGSIQHNFTQDLANLQQANQQWQDFSGQVADFDDTLNNQQLVQDPGTGIYYEAPYEAWDSNGPRGPGYYLSNGDQLNPVSRR
jgi:hypothetical protein